MLGRGSGTANKTGVVQPCVWAWIGLKYEAMEDCVKGDELLLDPAFLSESMELDEDFVGSS